MLVLLPPSEGKSAPAAGPSLDLAGLVCPSLTARRERLVRTLMRVSAGRPATALNALGLSRGQAGELVHNTVLRTAPTARAAELYSGVLFDHLRLDELPVAARARVLIASALWGVTRPDDRIPAYRLSMDARLPRTPALAAFWRPGLTRALRGDELVVDLRSGVYATAWTPPGDGAVVGVRAFREAGGRRTAISHMVKATRGDVARIVLGAEPPPRTPEEVAHLVAATGREVELVPGRAGWQLDVVERRTA